jgi:hypothetical protein
MKERLSVMLAALWWGSLTTLGFLVVPMLFAHLPTPAQAGGMAARLFSAQTWVSTGCGVLLLMSFRSNPAYPIAKWSYSAIGLIVSALLIALIVEFGVAPRIVTRENLRVWHTVGSALYALQWLCTGLLLWRLTWREAPRGADL